MPHIVLVDDEPEIRETFREYLELHGYCVTEAGDGAALRGIVASGKPFDLALLDIAMPGEDGLSLARFLRETTDSAIIMVTAAGEVVDRIVGLEIGADDYLSKPVDLRELLARIRAVLRRPDAHASRAEARELRFGHYRLNLESHTLQNAQGDQLEVTSMEFDLLKAFAEHPNRVLTRDELLDLAHHRRWEPFDRSIDIRVGRLRRKLEQDPRHPTLIKTVRGVGYVFSPTKD